jgi:hypothetical protein
VPTFSASSNQTGSYQRFVTLMTHRLHGTEKPRHSLTTHVSLAVRSKSALNSSH